jgi:hypothetical protein
MNATDERCLSRPREGGYNPRMEGETMKPADMQALLRKEPFQPFRVVVEDGRTYDITNPRRTLASDMRFTIGVPNPRDPQSDIADHFEWVEWNMIAGVEPLAACTTA